MIKKKSQKNQDPASSSLGGFTLVEALVAISIFTVSILALLSLLTQSVTNTEYAKQKIVATYLAQEGIEYMRNMRDTFVLYDPTSPENGWNAFNTKLTNASCPAASGGCYFDDSTLDYSSPSSQAITKINLNACYRGGRGGGNPADAICPELLYDSTTGKYGYASGTTTSLTREITSTSLSADETQISSTVIWVQGTNRETITFSEDLFNWVQ